jgi:hypothetical protein
MDVLTTKKIIIRR